MTLRLSRDHKRILRMLAWTPRVILSEPRFGHRNQQRFAIVASPRTGSNFLYSGLESSSQVNIYHEILGPQHRIVGKGFDKRMSVLYRRQRKNVCSVGLKIFYNHLTEAEWADFHDIKDFHLIHLTRKNLLRKIISLDIAVSNDVWTQRSNKEHQRKTTITLDTNRLIARLEKHSRLEARFRSQFSDRECLEVCYERLTSDPRKELRKVTNYLGIDEIEPGLIKLKKQNPGDISELLDNYAEVESVLRSSDYSGFLEG